MGFDAVPQLLLSFQGASNQAQVLLTPQLSAYVAFPSEHATVLTTDAALNVTALYAGDFVFLILGRLEDFFDLGHFGDLRLTDFFVFLRFVGLDVGVEPGFLVGFAVGAFVGLGVTGAQVGDVVGRRVGFMDIVGRRVGLAVIPSTKWRPMEIRRKKT